jgi:malate dehydrogenase
VLDIVNTPGVAADLSHINTPAVTKGYIGKNEADVKAALTGAQIVVIPAGIQASLTSKVFPVNLA